MTKRNSTIQSTPKQAKSTKRLTTDEFIRRAKSKHGDRYCYAKSAYKNRRTDVVITCRAHGDFLQKSINHMSGSNCPQCVQESRSLTTQEFIRRSKSIYGDLYTYEKTHYVDYRAKLTVTCKLHGDFSHRAEQHFNCNGCPRCSLEKYSGYTADDFERLCKNRSGKGILYVVRLYSDTESFYKVGITSRSVSDRFGKVKIPYKIEVIKTVKGEPSAIYNLEKQAHRELRCKSYKPKNTFAGHTECFTEITEGFLSNLRL